MSAEQKQPSLKVAALLWFLTGLAGGHRLYLKKYKSGFAMLALLVMALLFGFIPLNFPQFYPPSLFLGCYLQAASGLTETVQACSGLTLTLAKVLQYLCIAIFIILPIRWMLDIKLLIQLGQQKNLLKNFEVDLPYK